MNRTAIIVSFALLACSSSSAQSAGSAETSSATATPSQAVVPTDARPSTPAADSRDAITPLKDQPKRSPEDAAHVATAERSLLNAIAIAKPAKTLKEACGGVAALLDAAIGLNRVTPPKGFEREFSEARNGLVMEVDNANSVQCPDENAADADTMREFLSRNVRDTFAKLQRIGKK